MNEFLGRKCVFYFGVECFEDIVGVVIGWIQRPRVVELACRPCWRSLLGVSHVAVFGTAAAI